MQHTNFEQNFNLGPSPIPVRGTGSGKMSSSVTVDPRALTGSGMRSQSPVKAQREQAACTEQSLSTIYRTKEAKAFL